MRTLAAALMATVLALPASSALGFDLIITGGVVHGPGPMPDTPLPEGKLGAIVLNDQLGGASEFFNNGAAEPNVPGEMEIYGHLGGRLSNGAPFNEHVYGGVVSIGSGALKMLSVISSDGPMQGRESYLLDDRMNWEIRTDLAMDAGFPQGLVISQNIKIFTGVLKVAPSLQTEGGVQGGMNRAGSLPTGAPVYGMLGDMEERGFLDGRIVGVGRVPLSFMFVPGGPLKMQRNFRSDIPVTHEQAGVLTYAGLANLRDILAIARDGSSPAAARAYVLAHAKAYLTDFADRARSRSHLSAAGADRTRLAEHAGAFEALLRDQVETADSWAKNSAVLDASMAAIMAELDRVDQAVPALRAAIRFPQLGG
jgi:hypothetical protein